MLFKFTAPDMLNTSLTDVTTGQSAYDIVTVLVNEFEDESGTQGEPHRLVPSASSGRTTCDSRPPSSSTMASSSPAFVKQSHPDEPEDPLKDERRKTNITDSSGTLVAEIFWKGRHPTITICGGQVGGLTDLFGSTTVRFMPKILAIPTRFDTEYIWTATADSLTLYDYDTDNVKGTFHQNVVRIPAMSKGGKIKVPAAKASGKAIIACPTLMSLEDKDAGPKTPGSIFIPTHVPGLGSNYLEFSSHPLAHDVEIIISFLMMEILRRGRFNLITYTFEKPKLWQFKEAKEQFLRRIRRHTL